VAKGPVGLSVGKKTGFDPRSGRWGWGCRQTQGRQRQQWHQGSSEKCGNAAVSSFFCL